VLCTVSFAVSLVNEAVRQDDKPSLVSALQLPYLRLTSVTDANADTYLTYLSEAQQHKMVITNVYTQTHTGYR